MWTWFNGKKTIIGTIILLISAIIEQVAVGIWGIQSDWLPKAVQTCDWIGMALGGVGLFHKGVKAVQEKAATIDVP